MNTFLKNKGNYKSLRVYKVSKIIYDITYLFTRRFLSARDRTTDQMVQAARSGKQNIVEGSKAATTSMETQLKLTNVAKASLQELLEDYEDYLRVANSPFGIKIAKRHCKPASFAPPTSMMPITAKL